MSGEGCMIQLLCVWFGLNNLEPDSSLKKAVRFSILNNVKQLYFLGLILLA